MIVLTPPRSTPIHRFANFSEVALLSVEDVAELLHAGDPQEHVWAAWTLGLRLGNDVAPVVSRAVEVEPSAGARRHFVVILAAVGDAHAVQALAVGDPDPNVRATGLQYLARLTGPHDQNLQEALAARLQDEPSLDARVALLENLRPDAGEQVRTIVEGLTHADALAVRAAAAERPIAWYRPGTPFPFALTAQVPREPDGQLRRAILDAWAGADGWARVIAAACDFPEESALAALDLAVERGARFRWAALEPIALRPDWRFACRAVRLIEGDVDQAAREWLLEVVVESFMSENEWDQQRRALHEAAQDALPLLEAAFARAGRVTSTRSERRLALELRAAADRRLQQVREDTYWADDEGLTSEDIDNLYARELGLADLIEGAANGS